MAPITPSTKIALVTGANQGIGFAIAKSLASKPGHHVLLGSRDEKRGIEAAGKLQAEGLSVECVVIDVSSDTSILTAVTTITTKFPHLDILINNAGLVSDGDRTATYSSRTAYTDCFTVNAFGAAIVTECFIPLLTLSPSPRIVFITSNMGSLSFASSQKLPWVELPIYRASKAAMNMFMLHFATSLGKGEEGGKWKVNATCPGYCKTNLNRGQGYESPESGAENAVRLACLGEEGETGTYSDREGVIPW